MPQHERILLIAFLRIYGPFVVRTDSLTTKNTKGRGLIIEVPNRWVSHGRKPAGVNPSFYCLLPIGAQRRSRVLFRGTAYCLLLLGHNQPERRRDNFRRCRKDPGLLAVDIEEDSILGSYLNSFRCKAMDFLQLKQFAVI
jgi:hypothetical protein